MKLTRSRLRRFWRGILEDILEGNYISDRRVKRADVYAGNWHT